LGKAVDAERRVDGAEGGPVRGTSAEDTEPTEAGARERVRRGIGAADADAVEEEEEGPHDRGW
jgi:hypothetical protein